MRPVIDCHVVAGDAEVHRMAIHVEMIEGAPHPVGVEVLVHVDQRVADHGDSAGDARQITDVPNVRGQQDKVPVGQRQYIVVKAAQLHQVTLGVTPVPRGQLLVQLIHGQALDGVARQVDLADLVKGTAGQRNWIHRGKIGDQRQHVAVGEQLNALQKIVVPVRIGVGPDDVAIQIGGEGLRVGRRNERIPHLDAGLRRRSAGCSDTDW